MELSLSQLLRDAKLSVERPRVGARKILNLDLSLGTGWMFVALMAVMSALLGEVVLAIAPFEASPAETMPVPPELAEMERMMTDLTGSPLSLAVMQFVVMGTAAILAQVVGRLAGGTGSMAGAVVLMGWLQAILLLVQILQIVLLFTLPPLAAVVGLLGIVLIGWLLTNFIAELHGFRSAGLVFLGMVATFLALAFGSALVMVFVLGVGA